MIDFTTLKTPEEKLIALFLSVSPPMRQNTIIKTLDLNAFRCRETLKKLIEKRIIKTEIRFDVILYTALNESSTALNESPVFPESHNVITLTPSTGTARNLPYELTTRILT